MELRPQLNSVPSEQREKAHRLQIRREREEREAAERRKVRLEEERVQHERQIRDLQQREATQKARQKEDDARRQRREAAQREEHEARGRQEREQEARRQEARKRTEEFRAQQSSQRTDQPVTLRRKMVGTEPTSRGNHHLDLSNRPEPATTPRDAVRRVEYNVKPYRNVDTDSGNNDGSPTSAPGNRRTIRKGDPATSQEFSGPDRATQVQNANPEHRRIIGKGDQKTSRELFAKDRVLQVQNPSATKKLTLGNTSQRVQMPSFGGIKEAEQAAVGWGRGDMNVKPLQYKTDEQIEADRAAEVAREKALVQERNDEIRRAAEARQEEGRRAAEARNEETRRPMDARREQTARNAEQREPRQERRARYAANANMNTGSFRLRKSSDYSGTQTQGYPPPPPATNTRDASGELDSQSTAMAPKPKSRPSPTPTSEDIDGEYRATPFKSNEYQPSPTPTPVESSENKWQHLGPGRREPEPPSPPPPQPQHVRPNSNSQYQASPFDDDLAIDQKFREHQRQRDMRAQSPFSNPNITSMPRQEFVNAPSRKPIRCARCLEPGHHARDCMGPMVCSICKQAGHRSRDCQSQSKNASETGEPSNSRWDSRADQAIFGPRDPGNVFRRTAAEDGPGPSTNDGSRMNVFRPMRGESREGYDSDGPSRPASTRWAQEVEEKESNKPAAVPDRGWAGIEHDEVAEDPPDDRRARRSRRGFADEEEEVETEAVRALKPYERRKEGRSSRRRESDDDANDEALAAREERAAKRAARKEQDKADKDKKKAARAAGERAGGGKEVQLPEFVSVSNLAQQLGVPYEPFVQRLEQLGYDDVFPGKVLDKEISGMIAMEYEFDPVYEGAGSAAKNEEAERDLKAAPEVVTDYLPARPPVVTIMGHVDHGKTTILDYLRRTSVAAGEAGGITQHIGAFSVPLSSSGRTITFLDTPGHAAFMSMRQRGANVTDMVILVVAADDSVKPQTLESIRCAREAGVPMIVAVNKMDKPEADVQRVKNDLSRHGVEIEDFGGEVQVVEVSGKTGLGLDQLEESIVTLSEVLDHRSEDSGKVEGWVLEATTKRAGRVATVLVKRGTLRPGAILVAGNTWARVRTLRDERDKNVMEVGPGMPVEVDGWRDQPVAGDEVLQAPGEQKATDVVAYRLEKGERVKMEEDMEAINDSRRAEQERRKAAEKAAKAAAAADATGEDGDVDVAPTLAPEPQQDQSTGQQTIPFIIKADVSGSAEAVAAYIPSLTSPLIAPDILSSSVGAINESDVKLASASKGHIVAFNLPKNEEMRGLAESKGVMVLENNIIYRTLEQVKEVLESRLPAVVTQKVVGEAEVGAVFEIGMGGRRKMKIAGCKVRNGMVGRNARVRVLRGGERVYDGTINSLKNVKKDVSEMRKGTECGMGFEGWDGFQEGDQIQTYEEIREKRKL